MKPAPMRHENIMEIFTTHMHKDLVDTARAIIAARDKQWQDMLGEPVAMIIESHEVDADDVLTHDIDYFQDEIDPLPVGTNLYAPKETK
jgi:hypothetical protein